MEKPNELPGNERRRGDLGRAVSYRIIINFQWIYRFLGQSRHEEGRRRAAHPGLGTWIGASGRVPALPYPPPRLL